MNSLKRNLIVLLVLAFVVVTAKATLDLINMPEAILNALQIKESSKIKLATQIAFDTYTYLGVDLILVLLLIYFLSDLGFAQKQERVVKSYSQQDVDTDLAAKQEQRAEAEQQRINERVSDFQHQMGEKANAGFPEVAEKLLAMLAKEVSAAVGAVYQTTAKGSVRYLDFVAGYAYTLPDSQTLRYEFGEGLAGQAAKSNIELIINNVPKGYIKVISGLGASTPGHLFVLPIHRSGSVLGLVEMASFSGFSEYELELIRQSAKLLVGYLAEEENEMVVVKNEG